MDLGKDKYGGPFSEEEVENVKATLRLIPIIFICTMIGASFHVTNLQLDQMTVNFACFFSDKIRLFSQIITFGIPIYHFIVRPLLNERIFYLDFGLHSIV